MIVLFVCIIKLYQVHVVGVIILGYSLNVESSMRYVEFSN